MEKKVIINLLYLTAKPYLPAAFLLLMCLVVPKAYFGKAEPWYGALLYHFTHANIFHFLGNALVIVRFKPRWVNVPVAYLSASAAAIYPFSAMSVPTCGISGMIFAMLARRDALLRLKPWRMLLLNSALAFIPAYNWKIHLFSYTISYIIWRIVSHITK